MAKTQPPVPLIGLDTPPIEEKARDALSSLDATATPLLGLATPAFPRGVFSGCNPTTDASRSVVEILRATYAVGAYKEIIQESLSPNVFVNAGMQADPTIYIKFAKRLRRPG